MKTTNEPRTISITQRVARIENLDLGLIKLKLMDKDDGEGWTSEQSFEAEKWYKRFLILCLKYPDHYTVPNKELDIFWHYHILDTVKYNEDCSYTLGYFLHHYPYYGMGGGQDAEDIKLSFSETRALMKKEFGEDLRLLSKVFNYSETEELNVAGCKKKCTTTLCYTKCRCSVVH